MCTHGSEHTSYSPNERITSPRPAENQRVKRFSWMDLSSYPSVTKNMAKENKMYTIPNQHQNFLTNQPKRKSKKKTREMRLQLSNHFSQHYTVIVVVCSCNFHLLAFAISQIWDKTYKTMSYIVKIYLLEIF